jgi:uncharacterized peroxidase-related enzyme
MTDEKRAVLQTPGSPKPSTKIRIIEDHEATGDTAAAYDFWRAGSGRKQVPGIIKCFGARPDFLRQVVEFSNTVHFSEGHLKRRHKEMIASYVSYLNHCPYWLDSHTYFLRVQGASEQCVAAIFAGKLDDAGLTAAERALLDYAEKVTNAAPRTTAEDVQKLRDAGWSEDQIAEAVYVTAMFAFFNRVADAFGVPSQDYLSTGRLTPWGLNTSLIVSRWRRPRGGRNALASGARFGSSVVGRRLKANG